MLYISLKFVYIKTLKMLLHFLILRSSSGSMYFSLLKLHVKIVNMSLHLSVTWQNIMCLCMRCFQCKGGYVDCSPHTPLHRKQHIHKHMICCHITDKYNDVLTILTCNFSKEQYVLPEDDLRIETCRSIL